MKTLEQVLAYEPQALDGRDVARLMVFANEDQLRKAGFRLTSDAKEGRVVVPFTKQNVLTLLKGDLEFAFKKALDKRGISSWSMFEVIQMWNWVLEEGLEDFSHNDYTQYGLPLYKATALKYGFPNPIGDDSGSEEKYSEIGE